MIKQGSSWCDLVKHADGRVELIRLQGTIVACDDVDSGARRWAVETGHERLYLRAAADGGGRVLAAGQGEDRTGTVRTTIDATIGPELGGTAFPFSVLVRGESDGWTVFIQRAGTSYDAVRIASDGRTLSTTPHGMPHTSQGFLYLGNNGFPVFSDLGDDRIPGLWLPSPSEDGSVWAGQSHTETSIALFDATTGRITHLGTNAGQPPHIVQRGDEYIVCAYVHQASWCEKYRRPFAAVTPPPVEPPPPPPVEPPKETPLEFEQKHTDLMEEVNARFRAPVTQEGPMRAWTQLLAEQFAFSFPAEGWGCKSTSRGSTQSFDVMARQAGGRLWGYDLAKDGGRSDAELDTSPGVMDLTGQAFIPVMPRNHLDAAPPVTPPTQPPVTPPPITPPTQTVDLSAVLARLAGLEAAVANLSTALGAVYGEMARADRMDDIVHTSRREHNAKLDQILARPAGERCRFPRFGAADGSADEDAPGT